MKELMGGAIIAGLIAAALGLWLGIIILCIIAILAYCAAVRDEEIQAYKERNQN